MNNTDKLTIFINRLKKIGIKMELMGNFPWIYIYSINGKRVTERFEASHGFTIAYSPISEGQEIRFTDLKEIFKLIKKYK